MSLLVTFEGMMKFVIGGSCELLCAVFGGDHLTDITFSCLPEDET